MLRITTQALKNQAGH